jgi:hypothetical protein
MVNLKDSAARTEVGPHNTNGVVMEDQRGGHTRRNLRRRWPRQGGGSLRVSKKHARGDQENRPGNHNYDNLYTYRNS